MAHWFGVPQEAKVTSINGNLLKIKWNAPFIVEPNAVIYGFHVEVQDTESDKEPIYFDLIGDSVYEINIGGFNNKKCSARVTTLIKRKQRNVEKLPIPTSKKPDFGLSLIQLNDSIAAELDLSKSSPDENFHGYRLRYGIRYQLMKDIALKESITKYTIPDLKQGAEYEFRVAYSDIAGTGQETIKFISTPEGRPSAPPRDINIIFQTADTVCITWGAPIFEQRHGRIVNYHVVFFKTSNPMEKTEKDVTEKCAVFGSLEEHTEYGFHVSARTSQGSGPYSPTNTFLTKKTFIGAPNLIQAIPTSNTSAMVSWQHCVAEKNIIGYYIFYTTRITDDLDEWRQRIVGLTDSTHLENLDAFSEYTIAVATIANNGVGKLSEKLTVTIKPENIPRNLTAFDITTTSISLSWEPPTGVFATNYKIVYSGTKKFVDAQGITRVKDIPETVLTTNDTSCTLRDLSPHTTYNISVAAIPLDNIYTPFVNISSTTLMHKPPMILEPKIYGVGKEIKVVLSQASEEFGSISHYYLVVVPESESYSKQTDEFFTTDLVHNNDPTAPYIAAKFRKQTLPYIFVLGDNSRYEKFVNRELERGKEYRVFIRAVVDDKENLFTSSPYSEYFVPQ